MSRPTETDRIARNLATALVELVHLLMENHRPAQQPPVKTAPKRPAKQPAPVRKRTDVLSVLGKVPQPLRVIAERTGLKKHKVQDELRKLAAQGLAKMEGNRRSAVWFAAPHRNGVRVSA